jgi:mono/diheme cytochrome c family protein
VADWYNFIIQHNPTPSAGRGGYDAARGKGNAHENPNRDRQHGRIYRLAWEGTPTPKTKSLAGADADALVAALSDSNMFWRLTAQRLLVDGKRSAAVPALKQILRSGGIAAVHALWTLRGLDQLDREDHLFALLHADSAVRRNTIRALSANSASQQLLFDSGVLTDKDLLTRLAAFNKLAEFPAKVIAIAVKPLSNNPENAKDEWLSAALTALGGTANSAKGKPVYGPNILPNPSFEDGTAGWNVRTYRGKAEHAHVDDKARTGKHALRVSSEAGSDTSYFAKIPLTPNTDYRLSGWILTDGVKGAHGAMMNVHEIQPSGKTNALKGKSKKWRQVVCEFNSGDKREVTVNCLFGGWGSSTGTAWYDDVSLQAISYETAAAPGLQTGNADRGKKVFHEHAIASCIRCHKLGDAGGVIGPALDGIAARKERDYLLESLVKPNATIAEGFDVQVSPMPPMDILLTPQELADVLAYLLTLK